MPKLTSENVLNMDSFSDHKSLPPYLDSNQILYREDLIELIHERTRNFSKNIYLTARAGQGKTTLATQLLSRLPSSFLWYNLENSDNDFYSFYKTLCLITANRFLHFNTEKTLALYQQYQENKVELSICIDEFTCELKKNSINKIHLIFDGLNYLDKKSSTYEFISKINKSTNVKIVLILLSSQKADPLFSQLNKNNLLVLMNDDIAFSKHEIMVLYNTKYRKALTVTDINKLYYISAGWIKGIVALNTQINSIYTSDEGDSAEEFILPQQLIHYFRDYFKSQLDINFFKNLLKLNMFELTSKKLAINVTQDESITDKLQEAADTTQFLEKSGLFFKLHPMLTMYLMLEAHSALLPDNLKNIHQNAALFFLENNNYEDALIYSLRAGDYHTADKILKNRGIHLLTKNNIIKLNKEFRFIPGKEILKYAYLILYKGFSFVESEPKSCLKYFHLAKEKFKKNKDTSGEIIILLFLIRDYLTININYLKMDKYILDFHRIKSEALDNQPQWVKSFTNRMIATAHYFSNGKINIQSQDPDISTDSLESIVNYDFIINVSFNNITIYLHRADYKKAYEEVENVIPFLFSNDVDGITKMHIKLFILKICTISNYKTNYNNYKHFFLSTTKSTLLNKCNGLNELNLLEIQHFISEGTLSKAIVKIERSLNLLSRSDDHYKSLIFQYMAYIYGIKGKEDKLSRMSEESLMLRKITGGQYFMALNYSVLGGAWAHQQNKTHGEFYLEKALAESIKYNYHHLTIESLFHRAYLRLFTDDADGFASDITEALDVIKTKLTGFNYRWLSQKLIIKIFSIAVKREIEAEYINKIAGDRFKISFDKKGNSIPFLNIKTLGQFNISCQDVDLLNTGDLTRTQVELLSILISTKEKKISLDQLQMIFWPDSNLKKGRLSLNVTLNRLRTELSRKLKKLNTKHYLIVKNSELKLENCEIDTDQFIFFAKKGINSYSTGKTWQAVNMFRIAHDVYKGEFLPGIVLTGIDYEFKDTTLKPLFTKSIINWSDIIIHNKNLIPDDMNVIENALNEIYDNQDFVINLYKLYLKKNNKVKANSLLELYKKILKKDRSYSEDEIEEQICIIKEKLGVNSNTN